MKIFFLYCGPFGEQIINTVSLGGLGDRISGAYELRLEDIIGTHGGVTAMSELFEDPERFLPRDFPEVHADLLIVLGIHGHLSDLIPCIAKRLGARSVLYPIDDRDMIPEAKKTIENELAEMGVHIEFPEPFCSLNGSQDPVIGEFLEHFGRPVLQVQTNSGIINSVEVIRDTPCGSASCITRKLVGVDTGNREDLSRLCYDEQHNDEADNYCLAEMDPRNPLMQEAGDILKDALFEGCGIPTTKDIIRSVLLKSGDLSVEDLAVQVVGLPVGSSSSGCITRRAFNRYLEELEKEQKVLITPQNTLKLM
jgi:hypothetical protein